MQQITTTPRAALAAMLRRLDLAPAVWIIAGISFLAHVLVGENYGYFRDELYVLAMSHHLAFGYVDVPPLVPWITLIPRLLTGNALWAIHVISALVCAGTIRLAGLMVRLLGGTAWVRDSPHWDRRRLSSCWRWARSTPMMSSMPSGGRWLPPSSSRCCATVSLDIGSRSAWWRAWAC
jgi:hypothetical protein